MSAALDAADIAAAAEYCLAVEAAICPRSGRPRPGLPALLGAEDGHTVLRWHDDGIPLGLVLEVIGEVLRARQQRLGREQAALGRYRLFRPCAYLDTPVRARWEELQELQAAAAGQPRQQVPREQALAVLRAAAEGRQWEGEESTTTNGGART